MKVAVIQICSEYEPSENLKKIRHFISMAQSRHKIDAVFLPEVFYSMSDGTKATEYLVEDDNEHFRAIADIALDHGVYLIGGTAATKLGDKVINRAYNFDPSGKLINYYDKIHLFKVDLSEHKSSTIIDESQIYSSGKKPELLKVNDWNIGLGICFDVRFPELFRHYFSKGANLLTVSAAFTVPTGKAHWETLLRARAIENQSYVIAAAQWGTHNEKIKTYGHSMVVSPWGEVITNAGDGEGYIIADLDYEEIKKIRSRMNVNSQIST